MVGFNTVLLFNRKEICEQVESKEYCAKSSASHTQLMIFREKSDINSVNLIHENINYQYT
jgi:hypothetical protein